MFPMAVTGGSYTTAWCCSVGYPRPASNAYVLSGALMGYSGNTCGIVTQIPTLQSTVPGGGSNYGAGSGSRLQYTPQ